MMNGYLWRIRFVDPMSPQLVDRTNRQTVATTDPLNFAICISNKLYGDFLMTVFIHELGHCALFSYGFIPYIHKMTKKEYWIEMEEFICNLLADYGLNIFRIAYKTMGYNAWKKIPEEMEKLFA